MAVGDRIKIVRKVNKLNQAKFSKMLGLSQAHISNIEMNKDNPSEKVLNCICMEFNISFDWLKDGTGEMQSNLKENNQYSTDIIKKLKIKMNDCDNVELASLYSIIDSVIKMFDAENKLNEHKFINSYTDKIITSFSEFVLDLVTAAQDNQMNIDGIFMLTDERINVIHNIKDSYIENMKKQVKIFAECFLSDY